MFAVTLGVFWEIYEFIADNLVPGLDMQVVETGTTDTMVDMIVNTIGAAVVALLGYCIAVRAGELHRRRCKQVRPTQSAHVRAPTQTLTPPGLSRDGRGYVAARHTAGRPGLSRGAVLPAATLFTWVECSLRKSDWQPD